MITALDNRPCPRCRTLHDLPPCLMCGGVLCVVAKDDGDVSTAASIYCDSCDLHSLTPA